MLSRIATVLLVLAALVVCSTTLAVESSPVGVKAQTEEPQPGSEVAVPATTEWGMLIMVLLVMSATTAAMLGGGLPSRIVLSMPTPSPSSPSEEPEPSRGSPKLSGSPKNKSKRAFSHQRTSRAQARHDAGQSARRMNLSRSRRRREGPGCRGIR